MARKISRPIVPISASLSKNILDSLEDTHLWELAQRITSEQALRDLGLKALRLPGYKVDTVLYNRRDIELAAHEALKTWRDNQETPQEAYQNLYNCLCKLGWKRLAGELEKWVKHTSSPESPDLSVADSPTTVTPTAIQQTTIPMTAASPPADSATAVPPATARVLFTADCPSVGASSLPEQRLPANESK